jgi:Fe-S-cluster containining protein
MDVIEIIGIIIAGGSGLSALIITLVNSKQTVRKTKYDADNLGVDLLTKIIDELKEEMQRQKNALQSEMKEQKIRYEERFKELEEKILNLEKRINLQIIEINQYEEAFDEVNNCPFCKDDLTKCTIYSKFRKLIK